MPIIIPAAGRATRLRPITSNCSKAMVPINGRPTISYILDKIDPGQDVVIVDGELEDIRQFVQGRYPHVQFVRQHEQRGDLHAAYLGFRYLKERRGPVVIWFGDTVIDDEFRYDVDGPLVKRVDDPTLWVMTDGQRFLEKPKELPPGDWSACVGVYRFEDAVEFKRACDASFEQGQYNVIGALTNYVPKHGWHLQYVEGWHDVGNFENYYQTRARLIKRTSRDFNDLEVDTYYNVLHKRATQPEHVQKIDDEATWYRSLDTCQSLFAPTLIDAEDGELTITYESGLPLNEVLIYDDLPTHSWQTILDKLFDVMHNVFYEPTEPKKSNLEYMWIEKNVERVKGYAPEFIPWIEATGRRLVENAKYSQIIHGDLHTANIIFEPFTGKLKLVDPRGFFGESGPAGDQQYDVGKLWEDLCWGFTSRLAHKFISRKDIVLHLRRLTERYGYDPQLMSECGLLLLLTAVPFHSDDPEVQAQFVQTVRDYVHP